MGVSMRGFVEFDLHYLLLYGHYYKINNKVNYNIIPYPSKNYIPDADIIIATSWQTANWVNKLPSSKGEKFYFIQGLETWLGNSKKVFNTWKLPLTKIVISYWLKDLSNKFGEPAKGPITNAIDNKEFFIDNDINNRVNKIAMLYHRAPIKGGKEGIAVLKKIKSINNNIQATIFSSRKPNCNIPSWIIVVIRPDIKSLRTIYNQSSIFLHTSHSEGWGLTPAEAMMCGCAVVATKNKGIIEYIEHEKSGLLSSIGDINSLVNNIKILLNKDNFRIKIAKAGHEKIKSLKWKKSVKKLEKILKGKN